MNAIEEFFSKETEGEIFNFKDENKYLEKAKKALEKGKTLVPRFISRGKRTLQNQNLLEEQRKAIETLLKLEPNFFEEIRIFEEQIQILEKLGKDSEETLGNKEEKARIASLIARFANITAKQVFLGNQRVNALAGAFKEKF